MRERNWRFVFTGFLFLALAIGFFFFMTTVARSSNYPVELMKIVGQTSGVVGGVSIVLVLAGLIGKKS